MDGSDEKRAAEVVRQEEDGNRCRLSLVAMEERTANIIVSRERV